MHAKTIQDPRGFYFNGVFIPEEVSVKRETGKGIVSTVSGSYEFACPYCTREITGRDVILLKDSTDFDNRIQWTIPCQNCGRLIHKKDLVETNE